MRRDFVTLTDTGTVQTVFASLARTATPTPVDNSNDGYRGVHLIINCSAVTSSPSVVFTIQGLNAITGVGYTVLASAAIVGTGVTVLRVFPGATASANVTANDCLPSVWRVIATHGNSDSITYSVAANLLP